MAFDDLTDEDIQAQQALLEVAPELARKLPIEQAKADDIKNILRGAGGVERRSELVAQKGAPKRKLRQLNASQVEELANFEAAIESLRAARRMKRERGIDTGPISSMKNTVQQKLGIDNPDESVARAELDSNLAATLKAISGTAVNASERELIQRTLPSFDDQDDTYDSKTEAAIKRIQRNRKILIDTLRKAGFDVGELGAENNEAEQVDFTEGLKF